MHCIETRLKIKISGKAVDGLVELKGHKFDWTDAKEACKYDNVVKKIGNCVARVYGEDIKSSVVSGLGFIITKATYPSGDNVNDEKKPCGAKNVIVTLRRSVPMFKRRQRCLWFSMH